MNTFRHWFMWSAIEVAPGVYDWEDYDRQLDLAAEHGLQTIIAEHVTFAPEWAFRRFAGCELRDRQGNRAASTVSGSSAIGGHPGLCLDHAPVMEAAERFLRALAGHYKDHPALGGYDLWNECNIPQPYCYCQATAEEFRNWLRRRYRTLDELRRTWMRYSLEEWEDVHPPVDRNGHAELLDWLQFRIDHAYERLRWRVGIIRDVDPDRLVTAHGIAASLTQLAENAADDWRAAAEVDSYGFTWVAARKGGEPHKQWSTVDLVRGASRGKPFWHSEMQGGPLWLQPQVLGRPREDGRIATAEDVRLWTMVSFAGGVRGIQCVRWRPLLDGPLFGAFALYGMAGEPTSRSTMASTITRWANDPAQAPLWAARPVQGEIGILVVPECQLMTHVLHGDTARYSRDVGGVHRAFFDLNIQADYVHLDDIGHYRTLYLPLPLMLTGEMAERLRTWVAGGGTLISEGCPGYFTDHGHACAEQPGSGLGELFGVREASVEFTPDLLERGVDRFVMGGEAVACGVYLQSYEPAGGRTLGTYEDGRVAVVEHRFGSGRTLLVGTGAGEGYQLSDGRRGREWFRSLLDWAGVEPHIRVGESGPTARLHQDEDRLFLWVTNPATHPRTVRLRIGSSWSPPRKEHVHWGDPDLSVDGNEVTLRVEGQDAVIARLR
jgi:beta-galactosidase